MFFEQVVLNLKKRRSILVSYVEMRLYEHNWKEVIKGAQELLELELELRIYKELSDSGEK